MAGFSIGAGSKAVEVIIFTAVGVSVVGFTTGDGIPAQAASSPTDSITENQLLAFFITNTPGGDTEILIPV
jgi:altronate dehydratase